jgi:hypothetical protein
MDNNIIFYISSTILITLLSIAIPKDLKTNEFPLFVMVGSLFVGEIVLILNQYYIAAILLLIATFFALYIATFVFYGFLFSIMYFFPIIQFNNSKIVFGDYFNGHENLMAFFLAIIITMFLFKIDVLGGGDAVVVMGFWGIGLVFGDLAILAISTLFGYLLTSIMGGFLKFGFSKYLQRTFRFSKLFFKYTFSRFFSQELFNAENHVNDAKEIVNKEEILYQTPASVGLLLAYIFYFIVFVTTK